MEDTLGTGVGERVLVQVRSGLGVEMRGFPAQCPCLRRGMGRARCRAAAAFGIRRYRMSLCWSIRYDECPVHLEYIARQRRMDFHYVLAETADHLRAGP